MHRTNPQRAAGHHLKFIWSNQVCNNVGAKPKNKTTSHLLPKLKQLNLLAQLAHKLTGLPVFCWRKERINQKNWTESKTIWSPFALSLVLIKLERRSISFSLALKRSWDSLILLATSSASGVQKRSVHSVKKVRIEAGTQMQFKAEKEFINRKRGTKYHPVRKAWHGKAWTSKIKD